MKKEELKKAEAAQLPDDELQQVSGGYGENTIVPECPQCDCSGELVDMIAIGTDHSGRIVSFRCPVCGAIVTEWG